MTEATMLKQLNTSYKGVQDALKEAKRALFVFQIYLSEIAYANGKGKSIGNVKSYMQKIKNEANKKR